MQTEARQACALLALQNLDRKLWARRENGLAATMRAVSYHRSLSRRCSPNVLLATDLRH